MGNVIITSRIVDYKSIKIYNRLRVITKEYPNGYIYKPSKNTVIKDLTGYLIDVCEFNPKTIDANNLNQIFIRFDGSRYLVCFHTEYLNEAKALSNYYKSNIIDLNNNTTIQYENPNPWT